MHRKIIVIMDQKVIAIKKLFNQNTSFELVYCRAVESFFYMVECTKLVKVDNGKQSYG
jgi:hypothetical protein